MAAARASSPSARTTCRSRSSSSARRQRPRRVHDRPGGAHRGRRTTPARRRARTSTTRSSRRPSWRRTRARRTTVVLLSTARTSGSSASISRRSRRSKRRTRRRTSVGLKSEQYDRHTQGDRGADRRLLRGERQPRKLSSRSSRRSGSSCRTSTRSRTAPCSRRSARAVVEAGSPGSRRPAPRTRRRRSTSAAARSSGVGRRRHHLAVPDGVHRGRGARAPRVRGLTALDIRRRSLRRHGDVRDGADRGRVARAAQRSPRSSPSRRAAVRQQPRWQRFERDVEIGGFTISPLALVGWTIVGGIVASLVAAIVLQSLWGLLVGLAAPFVTRFLVTRRVAKVRSTFDEQLPDNLDVLAGAMRTGHSMMGALAVMVESADEPSKSEFGASSRTSSSESRSTTRSW